ncbi:GGDEF domain-containing protein [Actinoplanes sp. NPDC049316]|uniref:GGDEF domain-containing protein n=1 Tax=Actinoplanes sp. NPDC049316 TaxID=3154727 RepID=UPI003437ECA7
MFTILTVAAVAAVVAMLGGWAGYRLGTRRMATLQTALDVAVRTATTDPLTGLANRSALTRRLAQLDRERRPFVLAIVNLDRFSTTNQWGYRIGDQLLVLQAAQLRHAATQRGGTVYRLVADEFAVVWPATAGVTVDAAAELSAGVLAALRGSVELRIDSRAVYVHTSATAGVTVSEHLGTGDPTSRMLRNADTALQHGKRTAPGTAVRWRPGLPALPRPRRDSRPGTPTAGVR